MQAGEESRKIQFKRTYESEWKDCKNPLWKWNLYDYRIAPDKMNIY